MNKTRVILGLLESQGRHRGHALCRCLKTSAATTSRLAVSLAVACILGQTAPAAPPTVQELVNQFSLTNYFNLVSNKLYARQGMNRVPLQLGGMEHDLCRDAIYDELQRVGLNPYKDFFDYVDTTNTTRVYVCNVIAVKEGVQNPDNEIYVVGSHYDSKNNPGADDNATGVACQLEMARIFAPHHFARTIVFALYDAEERWEYLTGRHRLGSLRHADQLRNANIKGMISVDMIGWQASGSSSNRAAIYGRTTSPNTSLIRNDLAAAVTAYGDGLIPVQYSPGNISDHVAFADLGFQACLLIENSYSSNPNYHKITDYVEMPNYLNWTYAGKMCQSVIGYYATKLQPVDVTPKAVSVTPDTNGLMLISFTGLPGCAYATEVTTNLSAPVWTAFQTNSASLSDGSFVALDLQAASRPMAYYRARFVAGYTGQTNSPPAILTQPQSQTVLEGASATFVVTASGAAPLAYQWRFAGTNISGATLSSYTRSNAQTNHAGSYQVVVTNAFGAVTSQVAMLTVTVPSFQVVFSDNFDANTAANWVTNRSASDTRVTFNYDYANDGIPSAPNATNGTTRGVKFEANMTLGATAAISISPLGQSFSGDFRLRFDMWINANGPFPQGGNGSTEYVTAGVGTTGNRVQWAGAGSTADGFWFAVNGEGQAGDTATTSDYLAYTNTTQQTVSSGVYAAGTASNARGNGHVYYTSAFPGGQTAPAWQQANYPQQTGGLAAGTVGFAWRNVIISKSGNTVEWSMDGLRLATITNATFTASNIFVGYWDPFTSVSDNAALSFGLVDNVRVEVPAGAP